MREKLTSLAASCIAGEPCCSLTHSLPCAGEITSKRRSLGPNLCHLGGGVMEVKSNCSSDPLQWIQIDFFFFFCYTNVLALLWKFGFPQRISHPWVSGFCFLFFTKNLFMYVFIWLHLVLVAACGPLLGLEDSQWQHVGSSSLIRDWTQAPCFGSVES